MRKKRKKEAELIDFINKKYSATAGNTGLISSYYPNASKISKSSLSQFVSAVFSISRRYSDLRAYHCVRPVLVRQPDSLQSEDVANARLIVQEVANAKLMSVQLHSKPPSTRTRRQLNKLRQSIMLLLLIVKVKVTISHSRIVSQIVSH